MPPAARIKDKHSCPIHDGGPVSEGEETVIIGFQPAAREGDKASCKITSDEIKQGEPTVLIGDKPAARMGDPTKHHGKIEAGCPTVLIGSSAQAATLMTDAPFCEECAEAAAAAAAGGGT